MAGLIVVDTLARAMSGGDENASRDMGAFIVNIGMPRSHTNAHVAVIHHGTKSPNGSTPRGHSSLIGVADLVVEIAKGEDGGRTATITACEDDPDSGAMAFSLRVVELGTDQDGDPLTTCMADELIAPADGRPRLSATERKAHGFLADLIASEGIPLPSGSGFPDGLLGVSEDRWRSECEARRLSTAEKRDDRRRSFGQAFEGLMQKAIVAARDGTVWLTHQTPRAQP